MIFLGIKSGAVNINEFVAGCLRLRGEAKARGIQTYVVELVLHGIRSFYCRVPHLLEFLTPRLLLLCHGITITSIVVSFRSLRQCWFKQLVWMRLVKFGSKDSIYWGSQSDVGSIFHRTVVGENCQHKHGGNQKFLKYEHTTSRFLVKSSRLKVRFYESV